MSEVKEQTMREKLESMSNEELLQVYELMIKVDHYDPYETPKRAVEMYDAGISHYDLHEMVLERMK